VLMPDGRTGLLGTGLARPVDRARAEHALAALAALREDDDAAFAGAAIATGLLEEEAARSAAAILREVAAELLTGPARLDAPSLRAAGDRGLRATPRLLDAIQGAAPIPDDLWLGRTAAQLVATLARLRATHDWARLPLA